MERSTRLDLPLLLPEVQDVQADCLTHAHRWLRERSTLLTEASCP